MQRHRSTMIRIGTGDKNEGVETFNGLSARLQQVYRVESGYLSIDEDHSTWPSHFAVELSKDLFINDCKFIECPIVQLEYKA